MSSPNDRLDILRRDIDTIDIAIHDLIVKRGTIVEDIRKIKDSSGPALRPGREASIIRCLATRHRGRFPLSALICMWREMVSGFTHMQQPLSAVVLAPAGFDRLMRMARDHYGSLTPLVALPSASACIRSVADGAAHVAVLPLPADGDTECWWPMLTGGDEKAPRVITRLPFLSDSRVEKALVIGASPRDVSDNEASLIVIELSGRTSRGRIMAAISTAGFAAGVALASAEPEPDRCLHLVEVAGEVSRDDPRLAALGAQLGSVFAHAHVIGGYALPISL